MSTAPDVVVFVSSQLLSDNSEVFNVRIGDIRLHAISEDDARELAEKIVAAIEDHTNETAGSVFE